MNRIVGHIASLTQHLVAIATDPEQYRPARCPHCGYARVWRHGSYYRKADRSAGGALNPVQILRFLCGSCPQSCSRLPACVAPRRWYDWAAQQAVLMLLLLGEALHGCARRAGVDRRTARRWRDWLHERDAQFSFCLRSRWPELGRVADFDAFWRHVIDEQTLQQLMSGLDQELAVP